MRYFNRLIILLIILCIVVGCDNTNNYKVITCTKKANLSDNNTTADLEYKIYYEEDYVMKTISTEKITSDNTKTLQEYEESYKEVFKKYKNIKYYDNTLAKKDNTITSTTIINYDKVDSKKIIEIEGEDGNIFTDNGKVKLDNLLKVYKKYGSSCDD